jgi:hypothetical protein
MKGNPRLQGEIMAKDCKFLEVFSRSSRSISIKFGANHP